MRLRTRPVEKIGIHHSLTEDSRTLSWGAIRAWHLEAGMDDIGYHAGAEIIRDGIECLYGRPDNYEGAHEPAINSVSLGFCFVGNFDIITPSDELLEVAARRVIAPWVLRYGLTLADIVPHSDYAEKSCPGRLFDMDRLRGAVAWVLDNG